MKFKTKANSSVLKFILFLAIFAVCWYLGRIFKIDVGSYRDFLSGYPLILSGSIFVVLYVVTTTFIWFGPKDVLRIASALLFGALVSTVFVWIGEMVNAAAMFHLSRVLGREYVQQRLRVKSKELDQVKEDSSYLGLVALRLNPLIPFRLMDLGAGLTKVPFRKYFFAIVAVSFLRIFWLQYILEGIGTNLFKDMSAMVDYLTDNPIVVQCSAAYFLAVIVVTIAAVAARFLRKKSGKAALPVF